MKFDHVGLVVRNLARGRKGLQGLVRSDAWTAAFVDEANGIACQFGRDTAGFVYELLEPLGPSSPVYPALTQKRAILNHVAYLVDSLSAAAEPLLESGAVPAGAPKPAIAYGGKPIQFFVTPLNFIVELIEAPHYQHAYQFEPGKN